MSTLQTYPAESWDNLPSVDDTNDDRPRKKRRKYIAKAWLVWKGCYSKSIANKIMKAMDVNVAKSNAMASHPVNVVDASILNAFTTRTFETVPPNKSNAYTSPMWFEND